MATISTKEVKKFINAAKNIKSSNLLPIYSYVKLECNGDSASFCKSNGHSFVSCPVKAEFDKNVVFIIDERAFFGFVNKAEGDVITIEDGSEGKGEDKKEMICFSDGVKKGKSSKVDNVFPLIESRTDEIETVFDSDVLTSIFLSKECVLVAVDKVMRIWNTFCHIMKINKNSYVVGSNGAISYFKKFKQNLPCLIIESDVADVITKFDSVSHCSVGNYDLFNCNNTTYGFIKSEMAVPDLTPIFDRLKSEEYFVINRKKLLNFCETVVDMNSSSVAPEVSISNADKNDVMLEFNGIGGQALDEKVKVEKKNFELNPFVFQPKNMIVVLKDLGVEKIKLSYIQHNFLITSEEDKDYLGTIAELAKM